MPPAPPLRIGLRVGRVACVLFASTLAPAAASAQDDCVFADPGNDSTRLATLANGERIERVWNPHFVCSDGVRVRARLAINYSALSMMHLIGSVRYSDRTRELTADSARYFDGVGRLQASGRLSVVDRADGSRITNGALVYLRQTRYRARESMTVTRYRDEPRPEALVIPEPDSGAAPGDPPPEPYTLVGDRIVTEGDEYLVSVGDVSLERESMQAFADSLEYDQAADVLVLSGSARVVTESNELVGRTITMRSPGGAASEVHALRDAALTGEDLDLRAPQITVFLRDDALERLVATPIRPAEDGEMPDSADLVRPVGNVQDFELVADSLEVTAPGDVLERVFAAGSARSVSAAGDSLNVDLLVEVARKDWLEGDTVIVNFRPIEPDSGATEEAGGRDYEVETIVARVGAKSLYRLAPADSTARPGVDPPAVHYVVGDEITITMVDGEVEGLNVVGQTQGVHMEPLVRAAVPDSVADTLRAVPDTARVRVDTLDVAPPGVAPGTRRRPEPRRPAPSRKEEPWRRN